MNESQKNDTNSEPPITSPSTFVPGGHLYTDFASDSVPTPLQPVQTSMVEMSQTSRELQGKEEKSSSTQPKKPSRKDWIDTENPLHCKPCNFIAQNMEDFQGHSLSFRHIKKTAEVLELKVNHSKKVEEKKKQTSFNCEICSCSCNSESAWNSHLVGQKHRKNLEKQGAARVFLKQKMKHGMAEASGGPVYHKTLLPHGNKPYQKPAQPPPSLFSSPSPSVFCANDFAQYKEPLIGLEYVTEIQVTGQNPRYHCKLCDAKFDHNVKFPHLVGAKHRFNVLKEKNPAIAQEIRVGVKKRSELTGKLLEEAMKIEQIEGRQQVQTCIEASPFVTDTTTTTQGRVAAQRPSPMASAPVRGRGHAAPSRPFQKSPRGHPLKGTITHPSRGGLKRNNNQMNYQNQFGSLSGYGNNNQGYNNNFTSFETRPQFQGSPMRGRGFGNGRGRGRGRGRGGPYEGHGRGFNNKQYRPTPSFTSTSPYEQSNPGYNSVNQPRQSSTRSMLPQEAFTPRSPPRSHVNQPSDNMNHQTSITYQTGSTQPNTWSDSSALTTMASPSTKPASYQSESASKSTEETTQNLLKGLTDLGKLVSSEEDASIALQVSNALTQALLQYRMQNLQEEGQK